FNGRTLAFQANSVGSIPITRFNRKAKKIWYMPYLFCFFLHSNERNNIIYVKRSDIHRTSIT
ncbi:hypothetical protein, partial [Paenibacillus xylanexedens]|uniref:hypothetical protein n=1 Tax=Paenibacillus xylanexedens TaxID=528191 RepID=UPI001C930B51